MKFKSLLARIDRLPPCLCRLFARRTDGARGWVPKSHQDIAEDSGLPRSSVADMSQKRSWRGVRIDEADRFAHACGVNLADIEDAIKRLRSQRARLQHLRQGNGHQRRMIAALLKQVKP